MKKTMLAGLLACVLCVGSNANAFWRKKAIKAASVAVVPAVVAKPGVIGRVVAYVPSRSAVVAGMRSAGSAVKGGLSTAWNACSKENAKAVYHAAKDGVKAVPGYCTKENAKMVLQVVKGHPYIAAGVAAGTVAAGAVVTKYVVPAYKKAQHEKHVAILKALGCAAVKDREIIKCVFYHAPKGNGTFYGFNDLAGDGEVAKLRNDKRIKAFGLQGICDQLADLFRFARSRLNTNIYQGHDCAGTPDNAKRLKDVGMYLFAERSFAVKKDGDRLKVKGVDTAYGSYFMLIRSLEHRLEDLTATAQQPAPAPDIQQAAAAAASSAPAVVVEPVVLAQEAPTKTGYFARVCAAGKSLFTRKPAVVVSAPVAGEQPAAAAGAASVPASRFASLKKLVPGKITAGIVALASVAGGAWYAYAHLTK